MGKHHGSEGRKGSKIAPKKVPNVTSEQQEQEQQQQEEGKGKKVAKIILFYGFQKLH